MKLGRFTRYPAGNLAEIDQYKNVKFAMVREKENTLIPLHPPVLCRSFMGDALWITRQNKDHYELYGFDYSPSKDGKYDLDKTRLVMCFYNDEDVKSFERNIELLWEIEEHYKLNKTTYTLVDKTKKKSSYYIQGDSHWLDNTLVFSFYTFLLRLCSYEEITDPKNWIKQAANVKGIDNSTETDYIKDIGQENFTYFLNYLDKFFFTPNDCAGYKDSIKAEFLVHGASGFYNLINQRQYYKNSNIFSQLACEILK